MKSEPRAVTFRKMESDEQFFGTFHEWSQLSVHTDRGIGQTIVAIVEDEEGKIHQVYATEIKFLEPLKIRK